MAFTIAMIEDNADHAALAHECLTEDAPDVRVIELRDGAAAIDHFCGTGGAMEIVPHLVLLDINMPQVNGFDVLEAIRSDDRYLAVPIVIVSTSSVPRDIERALSLRANSYSTKSRNFDKWEADLRSIRDYWRHLDRSRLVEQGHP